MIDSINYMYIINVDLSDVQSFFEMRFKLKLSFEKKINLLNFL